MATDYGKLKVTELKDLLKERGVALTGLTRKQQFIDALEAEDAKASHGENAEGDDANDESAAAEQADEAKEIQAETHAGTGGANGETVGASEIETGVEGEKMEAAVTALNEDRHKTTEPEIGTQETSAQEDHGDGMLAPGDPPVLEKGQPVVQEPQRPATPEKIIVAQDTSSDTKKRKRRSPTPPASEETVSKKLKSAKEAPVELAEDTIVEDAPVPMEGQADKTESVQQYGSIDDVMDVETSTTPAMHSATRALYIRELIRPLQNTQLHEHLASLAAAPGSNTDMSVIENCHLDALRTHALVLLTSMTAASRVRALLHGTVWPEEPTRKPLWVDFVPDERVQEWIETEQASGRNRREAKRWEVVYDTEQTGEVTASLQEVQPSAQPGLQRQSSQQVPPVAPAATSNMNAVPLGPRADRQPSNLMETEDQMAPLSQTRETESPVEKKKPTQSSESFTVLDERFQSTTSKPKLYFQPVAQDLAESRLTVLEKETSRDWEVERRKPLTGVDGQLRRYTFESGDGLVDGGPDRGSFGVPEWSRPRRYGGGGGGRGRPMRGGPRYMGR